MHLNPIPTDRQRAVLNTIHLHWLAHHRSPSLRELAAKLCIATAQGAKVHVIALERKGLIEREPRKARTLRLTRRGHTERYQPTPKEPPKHARRRRLQPQRGG